MKHNLSKWTALLVFVGLMITGSVSLTAQTSSEMTVGNLQTAGHVALPTRISMQQCLPLGGEAITDGDYNETHPTLAANAAGDLFAGYETYVADYDGNFPVFASNADWTQGMFWQEAQDFTYPQADYKTGAFYATITPTPDLSGQVWLIDATDPANPLGMTWDWSDQNFNAFQSLHIGTYVHEGPDGDPGDWNFGCIAFTGYNGYSTPTINGCPFILYQDTPDGYALISWLNNADNSEHAANDIDLVKNQSYSVYDRNAGSYYQLLVRKDDFGTWKYQATYDYWYHPSGAVKQITDTANIKFPDVVANNNTVLVVAMNDKAGNQDIICYRSTNGFSTNTPITVANSGEDELYPQINLIGNTAVCTYIKGTQTYYKVSTDAGLNWGSEQLANEDDLITPVEYGATDTCAAGMNFFSCWQDGRGANIDIYYNAFFQTTAPRIELGTISGGIGKVTAQVKNTGTGAATNVAWSITVTGGILHKINVTSTGIIPTLAANTDTTVKTDKFLFGLGAISVHVTAADAQTTKTGKQLLFLTRI